MKHSSEHQWQRIVATALVLAITLPQFAWAQTNTAPQGGNLTGLGASPSPSVSSDSFLFLAAGDIADGVPVSSKEQRRQYLAAKSKQLDQLDPRRKESRRNRKIANGVLKTAFPVLRVADIASRLNQPKEDNKKQTGAEKTAAILDWVIQELPGSKKVIAPLGDLAYPNGTFEDFLFKYDKTWGKTFDASTNVRPVAGNHEYWVDGGIDRKGAQFGLPYLDYFKDLDVKVGEVGSLTYVDGKKTKSHERFLSKAYYAYDIGNNWRAYALNSNCEAMSDGCDPNSEQAKWLAQDLAQNAKDKCIVAYMHHPRFSSADDEYEVGPFKIDEKKAKSLFNSTGQRGRLLYQPHGSNTAVDPLWRILYAAGTDVVVTGHAHQYERFAPMGITPLEASDDARKKQQKKETAAQIYKEEPTTGIRHFVVGTGGGELSKINPNKVIPNSEFRIPDPKKNIPSTFGVLALDLTPTGYDWKFFSIETDAQNNHYVLDSSDNTTPCHKKRNSGVSLATQSNTSPVPVALVSSAPQASVQPIPSPSIAPSPVASVNPGSQPAVNFLVNGQPVNDGLQPASPRTGSRVAVVMQRAANAQLVIKVYEGTKLLVTKTFNGNGRLILPAESKLRYVVESFGKTIKEITFP